MHGKKKKILSKKTSFPLVCHFLFTVNSVKTGHFYSVGKLNETIHECEYDF